MKKVFFILLLLTLMLSIHHNNAGEKKKNNSYIKVVYFHTDYRCETCTNLENYSKETIDKYFGKELKSGKIKWKTINYEKKGNEHYVDDFNLFNKSLVMLKYVDGKMTEWKNCEKIWEKVFEKDEYIEYVKDEINSYLKGI